MEKAEKEGEVLVAVKKEVSLDLIISYQASGSIWNSQIKYEFDRGERREK